MLATFGYFKQFVHRVSESLHSSRKMRYFRNEDYTHQLSPGTNVQSLVDTELWKERIFELVKTVSSNPRRRNDQARDGGLYVGVGGVAYALHYAAVSNLFEEHSKEIMKEASTLINIHVQNCLHNTPQQTEDAVGFLLGNAGIFAVAAVLAKSAKLSEDVKHTYLKHFKEAAELCYKSSAVHSDELFVGRAGYLCGALWLRKSLHKDILSDHTMYKICDAIVESGRQYSSQKNSPSRLMYAYYNTEYLGAAHGLSSILQMLLTVPGYLQHRSSAERDVHQSVDYLLSLQTDSGNFPCATDELGRKARPEKEELIHWCHGAPGTVYLLAKAYLFWKDEKYMTAALKCGDCVWKKGLLKKGPGICHGIAGNGYVFLLLYRLTRDQVHLHRALVFAKFMYTQKFLTEARTPDAPLSLYEGYSGTICFLIDLLKPDQAAFPFSDVFD